MRRSLPLILVLLLGLICATYGLKWIVYGPGHPNVPHKLDWITGVKAREPVRFSVDVDASGTLHLTWVRDGSVYYQVSRDEGVLWTKPVELGLGANPHIFAMGEKIRVIGLRRGMTVWSSDDGGETWTSQAQHLQAVYRTQNGKLANLAGAARLIHDGRGSLYLIYHDNATHIAFAPDHSSQLVEEPWSLFYSRSDDFGGSWSDPVRVVDLGRGMIGRSSTLAGRPSIAVFGGALYAAWSERYMRGEQLYVARSTDGGVTWSTPRFLNPHEYGEAVRTMSHATARDPELIGSDDGLYLCYNRRYLVCDRATNDAGTIWRSMAEMEDGYAMTDNYPHAFASERGRGGIWVAWADGRYRKQDWWGYFIVPELFLGSSTWMNNDLFLARIRESGQVEQEVLTPDLSYVEGPIDIERGLNDRLYVFWSGKRKVGKQRRDSLDEPYELFFISLPLKP